MTFRYSEQVRNAGLDARVAAIGPSPHLKVFAAPEPDELTDADPGETLLDIVLPAQWMKKAENGVTLNKSFWIGKGVGSGKARSFRICDGSGACHIQGTAGGPDVAKGEQPPDLRLDNDDIRQNQQVGVRVFVLAAGNG